MTLRAGSYNASKPRPRGIIRNDGGPWYVCVHDHETYEEAKKCAQAAMRQVGQDKTLNHSTLPEGWWVFNPGYHSGR